MNNIFYFFFFAFSITLVLTANPVYVGPAPSDIVLILYKLFINILVTLNSSIRKS